MKSDDELKAECNRYVNGHCSTVGCLKRGGWKQGDDYQASLERSTCDAHEIVTLRAKLALAVEALENLQSFCGDLGNRYKVDEIEEILAKIRS